MSTQTLHVTIPADLRAQVDELARRNYGSTASEVRRALARHLAAERSIARNLLADNEEKGADEGDS